MRFIRSFAFIIVLLTGLSIAPSQTEASSVDFFLSFSAYHPAAHYYHRRPYYYRPYYRPYYYGYQYRPYYYGYSGYSYYPGWGEVRAEVKPQNAKVYLDGDYVGISDDFDGWWQTLPLSPGKHRLVFRAPGFAPYAVNIRVLPGRDYHIKYEMTPGDDVMDEREMQLPRDETQRSYPRDQYRKPESYREPERDEFRSRPPESRDMESSRLPLALHVEPGDATIYIDGNYYGTANENGGTEIRVLLPVGMHRIEVVRPGYDSFAQDVNVAKDGENRLNITLQKK